MAECRSCHAPVVWATGPAPECKLAPIDRGSADQPGGNVAVKRYNGKLYWRPLKKGENPDPGEHRGMNHFATCPDAAAWKGKTNDQGR